MIECNVMHCSFNCRLVLWKLCNTEFILPEFKIRDKHHIKLDFYYYSSLSLFIILLLLFAWDRQISKANFFSKMPKPPVRWNLQVLRIATQSLRMLNVQISEKTLANPDNTIVYPKNNPETLVNQINLSWISLILFSSRLTEYPESL